MMEHLKVIGFGYYGKPETVAKVFEKTVETYTFTHKVPQLSRIKRESDLCRINGFYLGFDNEVLSLAVFAADTEHNRRTYRHMVPIRKNRLN